MIAPTKPLELAERVEAATGPDRHLGREVLILCGKGYVSPFYRWLDPTASLDAAMTLVPEGWSYQVSANPASAYATVVDPLMEDEMDDDRCHTGQATGPALALTAACLRVRASQET